MMKTFRVDEVADTLLDVAREKRVEISNLKLQKLMYYAQAWSLVFYKTPLFREDFEAWVHGPVVPVLFRRFKEYGWKTINEPVVGIDDAELRTHLKKILTAYGVYGASQLERLTHSEDPWKEARENLAPDEPSRTTISRESMTRYYSRKAHGQAKRQG